MKVISFNKAQIDQSAGHSGQLKRVSGVNGTPRSIAPGLPDLEDQFNAIGIRDLRFHDALGFGDLDNSMQENDTSSQFTQNIPQAKQQAALKLIADLGNVRSIFPNAAVGMRQNNVDLAFKDANYTMTDNHFKAVMENPRNRSIPREILFRIGRTNRGGAELPENFDIYATLVSTLVDRYSRNLYKSGLPRKVRYWEIWNEPDLTFFWNSNNPQDYYQFYEKIARMIKNVDPEAKVGGAGVANGYNPNSEYIDGLLGYCRDNSVPIDFLSWHYYANKTADPQNIITLGNQIQRTLDTYGFSNIESLCTEWNSQPFASVNTYSKVQSAKNAAYIAATLIYMQYTKVDGAYYYRGDASSFGLFNASQPYSHASQAFALFNKLLETPNIISGSRDFATGLCAIAGQSADGSKMNILASNFVVDPDFSTTNAPKESGLYRQHYVDGNRQLSQLTDDYSVQEWFGGVNPMGRSWDNYVEQKNQVPQLPDRGNSLRAFARNYAQSNTGLSLRITNLGYRSCRLKVYRVKENGDVNNPLSEEATTNVNYSIANNILTITDPAAIRSTVTLYSLEFDNVGPTPTPRPTPTPTPTPRPTPTPSYITWDIPIRRLTTNAWPSNKDFLVAAGDIVTLRITEPRNRSIRLVSANQSANYTMIRQGNPADNILEMQFRSNRDQTVRSMLTGNFHTHSTAKPNMPVMGNTIKFEVFTS